ncbi:mannitol dehydrogenase family protein [Catellatospora methionotrophica]|uniref:mannitol dehydrogenase family protein n=1 Tax=Catellatospora methionotrophica TaxID=121620 RepID=UPI0034016EFD
MAMTVPATRLGRATLSRLPEQSRPAVRPGEARSGVLHFGLGAFHRAHQAVFIEAAMAARGGDWGIVAVAPRSRDVLEALRAQDHLYSVVTLDASAERSRVVGALNGTVHAASDPGAVVALLADPAIRVVTLTVTEKAYAPDAAVPRLLVDGLIARARADTGPITLLSCDNLPSNGVALGNLLSGMIPAELRDWYDVSVRCPSSMVDRIVPATTAATLAAAERCLGARDLAAVAAEPFNQWVIEDSFAGATPDWAAGGVVLTDDVTPWEHLKLRALNGVHSALAYLGALAGCDSIADALALPGMADLLRRYVDTEVTASMTPPDGVTVAGYGAAALERFANASLGHRCLQVAMDGSQKLPQRVLSVLNTVAEPALATLIAAAWARFAEGTADSGQALPLDDPRAAEVRADLSTEALFGPGGVLHVPDPAHRRMIEAWRTALATHGAVDLVRTAVR